MSYGLMVWTVDMRAVDLLLAGKAPGLATALEARLGGRFEQLDDDLWGAPVPAREAFHHILSGAPKHPEGGAVYAYVAELLLDVLGEALPNAPFSPVGLSAVQDLLAALGWSAVPGSAIQYGPCYIPGLPMPEDWPMTGFISQERCAAVYPLIRDLPVEGPALDALPGGRAWAVEAARTLRGWFEACHDRPGWGLAFFYH